MNKIVLVTGAFGFIGRNAARFFAQKGWTVIGIGHGAWTIQEWRQWGISKWHTSDITLDALCTYAEEPDVIVHCAGSGSVNYSMTHPYQDFHRTVETLLSVLEFVRPYAPGARIVYPSSAGVYGEVETIPIKESSILKPASPYGVHKKIAEELCCSYAEYSGISVSIVRLFSVYGIGLRKQLLWDACLKLANNDIEFFGSGMEKRDWLHVVDAAELLFQAADNASSSCPIVNGGTGRGVTVKEVLKMIFTCNDRLDNPVFSGSCRLGDPKHYVADISKTFSWGWKPRMELQKGLNEYVDWFKKGAL